ncbi:peroxin [Rhizina undulata]
MFAATRNFFKRHRKNFAIGVGLAGAGYLATQYVRSKFSEAKDRMSSDRIARDKSVDPCSLSFVLICITACNHTQSIRRRFQQNQESCTLTVQALMPAATEKILEELPVEKLTQELQKKKDARIAKSAAGNSTEAGSEVSAAITAGTTKDDDTQSLQSFASESFVMAGGEERSRKSKAQLWDEIKISSLTRSFTLLYTLALLTILTRVQLNLLGRKSYLSSVVSLAERDGEPIIHLENREEDAGCYAIDSETNEQYLMFSWWLLHRGWRDILKKVDLAVKQVFGRLTPRDTISLTTLRELTGEVRKIVEGHDGERKNWLPYLLPPRDQEYAVLAIAENLPTTIAPEEKEKLTPSPALRRLLDETSDLIDFPMASEVVSKMLNAGFEFLLDTKLAEQAFKAKPSPPAPITTSETPLENAEGGRRDEVAIIHQSQQQPEEVTTRVASVLAVLARQAHFIGNGDPNSFLQVMEGQKEVEAFSALVYSSNFEYVSQLGEEGLELAQAK